MRGFTLLELMVVILLAGILSAIALPQFSSVIARAQQTSIANALVLDLNYARSEAIKRNQYAFVCPLPDDVLEGSTTLSCGNDWNNGWQVVVDVDDSGSIDNSDLQLRVHESPGNRVKVGAGNNAGGGLRFNALGLVNSINGGPANDTAQVRICLEPDTCDATSQTLKVIISRAGRIRTERNL